MTRTLIRQVRLITPLDPVDRIVDVLVVKGVVQAIAPALHNRDNIGQDRHSAGINAELTDTEIIEAADWVLGPGLVDLYSQSGEPGHESRETLRSLEQAALAGGFTRVAVLPNTDPPLDDAAQIASLRCHAQLRPWGAITLGLKGEQLTDLAELAEAGVVGFTEGAPMANPALLRRLLEYAQPLQRPLAIWPCDRTLAGHGTVREGADSARLGHPGIPTLAETAPLAALLEYIAELNTPVHVMRVSTARSVELLRQAKARGLPVTASVPWLHLMFNTQDLVTYDPNLRLEPPLGAPSDQQALLAGLEDGTLDAIAIDHTAYTYEEKTVAFGNAPPGAIGLELALPVLWQTFVATQRWHPRQLWQYLSLQPAQCLKLDPPTVKVGQPAEMVLFNPQKTWTVSPSVLQSRSANTPWLNKTLEGRIERTWIPNPAQN
ncbi:MAG: dihydroorotase [Cyanobacteria bacterium P01_F01_bin.4]